MAKKTKKENPYKYKLYLTEKQARLLSYTCDRFSRCICGQDGTYQELFEQAWEKRAKKATGNWMDQEFEGGWSAMRDKAEDLCKEIKKVFWGLDWSTLNGIYYDKDSDILYDLYQVIRHQLWLDRPDDEKSTITVDADEAMHISDEPLPYIERIKENKEE